MGITRRVTQMMKLYNTVLYIITNRITECNTVHNSVLHQSQLTDFYRDLCNTDLITVLHRVIQSTFLGCSNLQLVEKRVSQECEN